MRKKRTLVLLTSLLLMFALGTVFAQWLLTRPVQFSGTIVAAKDMQVFSDIGCTTVLTSIDMGSNLYHNNVVTKTMYLKNIGEILDYVGWNCTGLPSGASYSMTCNGTGWNQLDRQTLTAGSMFIIAATVNIGTAPLGAFGFTLNFRAEES